MSKRVILVSLGALLACGGMIAAFHLGREIFGPPAIGAITGAIEKSNGRFAIRVDRHAEDYGGFVPGAYYSFRSAPASTERWQNIMTVRHDDPIEIPEKQLRFVDAEIGYVFMCSKFAVTTDGGQSWVEWDASQVPGFRDLVNYSMIADVALAPDGKGTMRLNEFAQARGGPKELHTTNYGKTWQP